MVSVIANFWLSFLAGLFAPLGAVCVLPLYPGFLAYLASKLSKKDNTKNIILLGIIVVLGVLASMFIIGLVFSFLQESLSKAIGIISPIAFGILAVLSIFLIIGVDFTKFAPKITAPVLKNPMLSSFIFGIFFGAIVIPCNPAPLIVLFAISTSTVSFITNLLNFFFFGLGMGLPLLLISFVSAAKSQEVLGFLSKHQRIINIIAGIIMLGVSVYYLIFVFNVHQLIFR